MTLLRIGVLTPSSNTNVEPTTYAMLREVDGVTAHFSRFPLPPLDETIDEAFLEGPSSLLAEAEVDVLVFHGTAGSWTGIEQERVLCKRLEDSFAIPATTATLATLDALGHVPSRRLALAFPGPQAYAQQIDAEYGRQGFRFASITSMQRAMSNVEIGRLTDVEIDAFVRSSHRDDIDTIVVVGTNLRAAPLAAAIEADLGVTVVDSTAATLWHVLRTFGVATPSARWGRLFDAGS